MEIELKMLIVYIQSSMSLFTYLNIKENLPCACSFGKSLSRMAIFPLFSYKCLSVVYGGPRSGNRVLNKYFNSLQNSSNLL